MPVLTATVISPAARAARTPRGTPTTIELAALVPAFQELSDMVQSGFHFFEQALTFSTYN